MYLYFIPILTLFYFSKIKLNSRKTILIIGLLMLFLCFGYMTGSDWRIYETVYYEGYKHRIVEPGYMWLSNQCSELGLNFWFYHILIKCIIFCLIIWLFVKIHGSIHCLFAIGLWYASDGIFMFIDCPFRNIIACGISVFAFYFYLKKQWILYYVICLVASLFHYSAIILFILPFLKFCKINSRLLVVSYFILLLLFHFFGITLMKLAIRYLPIIIYDKINYYEISSSSIISAALIPRLICLYLIIGNRKYLENLTFGKDLFNLSYTYLIMCLIYFVFPMLFRSALFLVPFYISAISIGLKTIKSKKCRTLLKVSIICLFLGVVFTTVRKNKYVPYTNIIYNCISNQFYDYNYRDSYNFKNSPYKD